MSNRRPQRHEGRSGKFLPPLYTAPEVLRAVALALDTKGLSRDVGKAMDEYVSKGQYIHDTHCRLLNDGIVEPIGKHLTPDTKKHFSLLLESLVERYQKLALQFPCYDKRRGDVSKATILLCVPLFMDALEPLIERLRLPALDSILAWSSPVGEAISWLKRECPDWAMAVKDFAIENNEADYVERWATGKLLPSAKSLLKFIELVNKENRERALILLLVARAFAHSYRVNEALRDQVLRLYSPESQPMNMERLGIEEHEPSHEFHVFMTSIIDLNLMLQEDNMVLGARSFIQESLARMDQYHRKSALPPSSRWILSLVTARAAVADGQLQQALAAYKQAFAEGMYSAGESQVAIIEEALCVASMQGDVRFLEKLKNQAIGFGMTEAPAKDHHDPRIAGSGRRGSDFVEDWEIRRWRERFHMIFPARCRFIDAAGMPEEPAPSCIVVNPDEHIEPDLRHPDRVVQYSAGGGRYRMPQIHWFAHRNDVDSVKKLVEKGADYITPWKEDGSSVLHVSVRKMGVIDPGPSPDDSLFRVVAPMIENQNARPERLAGIAKMITTPLLKKQMTVLGSAVETCRPDVVRTVLGLGAPVDQRHTISRLTPLYWTCQLACLQRKPEMFMQTAQREMLRISPAQIEDINSRYGVPLMSPQSSEWSSAIILEVHRAFMETRKGIDRAALIEIARILLENGADSNACHDINGVQRRTPLMLATEANDLELFDLMVEFGGDIRRTCLSTIDHSEYSCMDIALRFGAGEVLDQLRLMSEPQ